MRIATFNLENLEPITRSGVRLSERQDILRPQLERLRADILCLQEVNGQRAPGDKVRGLHALDALLAGTDYETFHRVVTTGPSGEGVADVHNLVILSRLPISSHAQIRHDLLPPLDYRPTTAQPPETDATPLRFDRPVLSAETQLPDGRRLIVFNVHFRAPLAAPVAGQKEDAFVWRSVNGWAEGFYMSALKRTGQALEVRLAVDAAFDRDPHASIVVCGDFNAQDHETALKILIGAEEDTGNGLLADRSLVLLDRALPRDRRFSVLHHGRPQMLDHVLASWPMMAGLRGIECHNEALGDELVGYAKVKHSSASYHAPLVAEFDL